MLCGFVVATFHGAEHRIIPDEISIGGTIAGVVFSLLIPQLHGQDIFWKGGLWSIVGLLAGAGPIYLMGILGNVIMPRSKRKVDNMLKEEFSQVMKIAPDVFDGLWDDLAKNGYIVKKGESADVLQTFWDLKNAGELKLSPDYAHLNKKVFKLLLSDTMGMGDVKLMAMVGAFLGWKSAILSFFLAPFFGAIFGMVEKFRKGKSEIKISSPINLIKYLYQKFDTGDSFIAYGPFLVLGALICLFKGEVITRWVAGVYGIQY
jgi:leader peptidase (prepilin peptidase)/N-methyltransferase